MDIRNTKLIRSTARRQLGMDPMSGRLVLLHTAVTLLVGLLVSALDFYLTQTIDNSGGLAGLQKRSVLETVQSVLQLASSILLPFWQLGFLRAAMAFARQEEATPYTLTAGLRRFGPLLRLMLLRGLMLMGLLTVCSYLVSFIMMSTPMGEEVMDILAPTLSDNATLMAPATLDEATMEALIRTLTPVLCVIFVLFAGISIPLLYLLRLSDYFLLDDTPCGVMRSIGRSFKCTSKSLGPLLRLDLSFWWFYLLEGVCVAVAYGDMLLQAAGITLPVSEGAAYFGFYILSLLLQLVLYRFAYGYLHTSRAIAYDVLRKENLSA